jgi:hypothetical protein
VSVFSIDGEFIRHVGGGLVKVPHGTWHGHSNTTHCMPPMQSSPEHTAHQPRQPRQHTRRHTTITAARLASPRPAIAAVACATTSLPTASPPCVPATATTKTHQCESCTPAGIIAHHSLQRQQHT